MSRWWDDSFLNKPEEFNVNIRYNNLGFRDLGESMTRLTREPFLSVVIPCYNEEQNLKKRRYWLALILVFAFGLRFYRFFDRWILFGETARDILVGREALKLGRLPLVGSFSSAGPFVFGPLFYWLIALSFLPNINYLQLPFITIGLLSVLTVWVMYKLGVLISGKRLGLILALLTAVSPAQIQRALSLTQHSLIGITSALAVYFFILYLKKPKTKHLFYLGLSLGAAFGFHTQAINLLPLAGAVFLPLGQFRFQRVLKNTAVLLAGLILPLIPFFYWDSLQEWANLRNILDYFLIAQYRKFVPRRWLTYAFDFWPTFWSSIIGGGQFLGYLTMFLIAVIFLIKLWQRKLSRPVFWLSLIFIIQIIMLRYYRATYAEGYLIYFHPLVLFFTAWLIEQFCQTKKLVAIALLIMLLFASLHDDVRYLTASVNDFFSLQETTSLLKTNYPREKFTVYDSTLRGTAFSLPLSLMLDSQDLISENGQKIGICIHSCDDLYSTVKKVNFYGTSFALVDLNGQDSRIYRPEWYNVNPRQTYFDTLEWWKEKPLTSPFSLSKFIIGKLTGDE